MTRPSFLGIGAQKCASTWVYDVLSDHPETNLSAVKELDFFSYHYDKGYAWYERQFTPGGSRVGAIGEVSPSYFHEPAVPARVHEYAPELKIVLSLRDPVERAISHHRHAVRIGDVVGDDLSFETALEKNPTYLDQGRYATHLSRWLEFFSEEQVLVLFLQDIVADAPQVAQSLYRFLEIEPSFRSEAEDRKSNKSHFSPHSTLERSRKLLKTQARGLGLGGLWEQFAKLGVRDLYRKFNRRPSDEIIPPARPETLVELRAFFDEEVSRLEDLVQRDLSAWK